MSVINPNETSKTWRAHRHEPTVELYLSGVEGDSAALVGARIEAIRPNPAAAPAPVARSAVG